MDKPYRIKLADKLVFIVSASLVGMSYLHFWSHDTAQLAIIRDHQSHTQIIDLHQETTISIAGALGISILEVKNRQLRFTKSPCTNKLCIQSGWHQHSGDIAACLPNRVSVQLARNDSARSYDAINF